MALALLCGQASWAQETAGLHSLEKSATQAREAGNAEQAIAAYKSALALQPDWREGLWYLGTMNYDLDRYADAVPPLTRLIRLDPESAPALSFLGLAEFETRDYPNALAHLEKAHALGDPDDPSLTQVCAYHLALLLNRTGDFDRASSLLRSTFPQQDPPAQAKAAMGIALLHIPLLPSEIDPSHDALLQSAGSAAALLTNDPRASADALAQLIAQNPAIPYLRHVYGLALDAAGEHQQATAAQHQEATLSHQHLADLYRIHAGGDTPPVQAALDQAWKQAMDDYTSMRYAQTIGELKTWVQQKPDDGTAWAVMGLSEFELKDYDNALIHLERGRQLGVGASTQAASFALYHLALLLNRSGNFDAATTVLAPLRNNDQLAGDIRFALGLSLLHMRILPSEAENAQRSMIETAGQITVLLLDSKYDAAFPQFQRLIAQHPAVPWLHYAYGTALESLSQYDEAKTQMREELKLSPLNALPWIRIASISLRQHQPEDALSAAKTAAQLAPGSADAHYVLGRAWLEQGKANQAIPELEQAVSLAPNSPEPHFALAHAYTRAGITEKAEQERSAFARLNALAEKQRASQGDQTYQGPREGANSSLLGSASANTTTPQQP